MGFGYYILDDKLNPVQVKDVLEWEKWFEKHRTERRKVAWNEISGITISTVFLGLDYSFFSEGNPLLFETMIFNGSHDQYQTRSATWEEALIHHAKALRLAETDIKGRLLNGWKMLFPLSIRSRFSHFLIKLKLKQIHHFLEKLKKET